MKNLKYIFIIITLLGTLTYIGFKKVNLNPNYTVGEPIDSLNHVVVYYNGGYNTIEGRNTDNGYNVGLKYQCVEYVKRYYLEYYNHQMPNSYGNAKDFFNTSLKDGDYSKDRGLNQFTNPSQTKPKVGDLLIYSATIFNSAGHVAIVSNVTDNEIEIIQQNAGPFSSSREKYALIYENEKWRIDNSRILGWLRK